MKSQKQSKTQQMLSFAAVAKKLTTPKSDTNDQQQQKEKKKVQKAYDRYEKSYAARGKILDSEDEQQLDDKWGNDDDLLSSSDDSAQDERKKASSSSTPNHTSTNHNNNSYDTATTSTDGTKKIQKRTKNPPHQFHPTQMAHLLPVRNRPQDHLPKVILTSLTRIMLTPNTKMERTPQ